MLSSISQRQYYTEVLQNVFPVAFMICVSKIQLTCNVYKMKINDQV